MKSYQDQASAYFEAAADPATERYVNRSISIALQINTYLTELDWSQKEFAKRLGKTEAEVSKWLSGVHNLTLKSIEKMAAVLDRDIIVTPLEAQKLYQEIKYVTLRVHATTNVKEKTAPQYNENTCSGNLLKFAI